MGGRPSRTKVQLQRNGGPHLTLVTRTPPHKSKGNTRGHVLTFRPEEALLSRSGGLKFISLRESRLSSLRLNFNRCRMCSAL